MYGAISFYNQMKAAELHPILGYEAYLTFESRLDKESRVNAGERPYYNLVLLAKDLEGYYNLAYLASKAFTEGFHHKPRIDLEILARKSKGLIGLSSGFSGAVWHFLRQNNFQKASENASLLKEIFGAGNFFIEIQDHGLDDEKKIQKDLVLLSKQTEVPLVATNDAYYLTNEDARAHEILMAIGEGKTINDGTRTVFESQKYYLRSKEEMWEMFGAELPESINNTLKIAENCRVEFPEESTLSLPNYPIPSSSECRTVDEYFEKVVMDGFETRKNNVWTHSDSIGKLKYTLADYQERIRKEINTIKNMKFPGYFLIVWDFIKYARQKDIPVGPGRGSAAGSLVA
jgi:DNA polymerase-3 subunit alpha